ncbi:MAG TPA: S53 family peptidase [Pseudonocardiaceae bacterium]|jgi:subtilase family serine protease|nr:S53 family peptidase [Pseudonocardiaceae bacterium]
MRRSVLLATAALITAGIPATAGTGAVATPDVVHIHPITTHAGSATALPLNTAQCEQRFKIACFGPEQLQRAYDLEPLFAAGNDGEGQTIAIVDSYGSPTLAHDLQVFDQAYGLPTPKLTVIEPAGAVPPYDNSANRAGWAGETSLDVEWAHAMAPKANLLVVATPTSEDEGVAGFPEIVRAERYVVDHHLAAVISQSFSATEQTFPGTDALLALRTAYQDAADHDVTVLAASGDSGATDATTGADLYTHAVTSWPNSDPLVTGVGGTQLHLDANGARTAPDSVWNDSYDKATQRYITGTTGPSALAAGGGLSTIFDRPVYQTPVSTVVGDRRGVPDIAMSAACNGAVNVYQSFGGEPAGWYPTCGTSEATPLFAGVVALAAQRAGHPLGLLNPALYFMGEANAPGLVDVTSGDNTVSFSQGGRNYTVDGFHAAPGYDLASGVGTVDAALFVPQLVFYVDHSS